jgi:hypothetical protein
MAGCNDQNAMKTILSKDESGKKMLVRLLIAAAVLAAILLALFFVWKYGFDPSRGTTDSPETTRSLDTVLTKEEAQRDLDYMYDKLRTRHPAWLDRSDKDHKKVEKLYRKERAALGSKVTVLELWRTASRILAVMNDGHTTVQRIGDYKVVEDLDALDSGTLTAVNGEDAEKVFARFRKMNSSETEATDRTSFNDAVLREDYLRLLGFDVSKGVTYEFKDTDGKHFTRHYRFVDYEDAVNKSDQDSEESLVYSIYKKRGIGLFDLNSCDYNDEYVKETKAFFRKVINAGCGCVIVDLRDDPGGNSYVVNEFLRHIDTKSYLTPSSKERRGPFLIDHEAQTIENRKYSKVFKGKIYVLTNASTFSAAMDFAMYIQDNGLGTVVGEASGNMPDSYGDALTFSMPESRLCLTVSYKKWIRIDESKSGQPITPDIPCDPDKAYKAAVDDYQAS